MTWTEHLRSVNWAETGGTVLVAYLLGCFATGYYLVRHRLGRDIRELGSGSTGARNVGRVLGKAGFLLTLLGDFGKGALATGFAFYFTQNQHLAAVAMLAVVAGHLWPVQLRGRGGKGAATSLGALLVYDFRLALAFLVLFAVAFVLLRKTVLPGLLAFTFMPLVSHYLHHDPAEVFSLAVLAAFVLFAHRQNVHDEFCLLLERHKDQPKHHPPDL